MYGFNLDVMATYAKMKKDSEKKQYCIMYNGDWVGLIGDTINSTIIQEVIGKYIAKEDEPLYVDIYECLDYIPELSTLLLDDIEADAQDCYENADIFRGVSKETKEAIIEELSIFMQLLFIEKDIMPCNFVYTGDLVGEYNIASLEITLRNTKKKVEKKEVGINE